jgi:hypothetical protein
MQQQAPLEELEIFSIPKDAVTFVAKVQGGKGVTDTLVSKKQRTNLSLPNGYPHQLFQNKMHLQRW